MFGFTDKAWLGEAEFSEVERGIRNTPVSRTALRENADPLQSCVTYATSAAGKNKCQCEASWKKFYCCSTTRVKERKQEVLNYRKIQKKDKCVRTERERERVRVCDPLHCE